MDLNRPVTVVSVSSVWKAVAALTAVVAVGVTAHGMFVAPSIISASKDAAAGMIDAHNDGGPHPDSAPARELRDLKAQVASMQTSVNAVLVEQGRISAQLEGVREDVREIKNQ